MKYKIKNKTELRKRLKECKGKWEEGHDIMFKDNGSWELAPYAYGDFSLSMTVGSIWKDRPDNGTSVDYAITQSFQHIEDYFERRKIAGII